MDDLESLADELKRFAVRSGADQAVSIGVDEIVVADSLAALCKDPGCPHYGLAPSCPPHVSGPDGFRAKLRRYRGAIFLKIGFPSGELSSEGLRTVNQRLNRVAASTERRALSLGGERAESFTGGSCKDTFCHGYETCSALSPGGGCRFPDEARPSMSGFGVDVQKLAESAGWEMRWAAPEDEGAGEVIKVYGLVLFG